MVYIPFVRRIHFLFDEVHDETLQKNINRNSASAEIRFLVDNTAMLLNPASIKKRIKMPSDPKLIPARIGNA